MEPTEQEITAFVNALGTGEGGALEEIFATAYTELCGLAHAQRRRWSGLETLSTTVVVHEAYLKLSQQGGPEWRDRGHFFRIAARAMRFILSDYAKRGRRAKRGGESPHVSADAVPLVDEALSRLARQRRVIRWSLTGLEAEEVPQRQRVGHPPGDPVLRVDALDTDPYAITMPKRGLSPRPVREPVAI